MDRPACIDPSNAERAAAASAADDKVTNPKPLGLPVARSRGRLTFNTVPPDASNN